MGEALRGNRSDLLMEVRTKSGNPALVYVLVEHRSALEPGLVPQLAGYMIPDLAVPRPGYDVAVPVPATDHPPGPVFRVVLTPALVGTRRTEGHIIRASDRNVSSGDTPRPGPEP